MRKGLPRYVWMAGALVVGLSWLLSGCKSQEAVRLPIQAVGEYSGSFEHDGQPVRVWTDLDIEYIGTTVVWYEVSFSQKGTLIQTVACDPLDPSQRLMPREAEVRGVTKLSYLALMKCEVVLPEGLIEVKAILHADGGEVEVFRGDLIINYKE